LRASEQRFDVDLASLKLKLFAPVTAARAEPRAKS